MDLQPNPQIPLCHRNERHKALYGRCKCQVPLGAAGSLLQVVSSGSNLPVDPPLPRVWVRRQGKGREARRGRTGWGGGGTGRRQWKRGGMRAGFGSCSASNVHSPFQAFNIPGSTQICPNTGEILSRLILAPEAPPPPRSGINVYPQDISVGCRT